MTRQEAIHLIEWLQKTPTAKQFYGIIPEELLRYYEEQNQALRIHDVVGRSEQLCKHKSVIKSRLRKADGKSKYCKDCQEWLT